MVLFVCSLTLSVRARLCCGKEGSPEFRQKRERPAQRNKLMMLGMLPALALAQAIPGVPYGKYVQGVNYGGRFIAEHFLEVGVYSKGDQWVGGVRDFYAGVTSPSYAVSMCDVAYQKPAEAGARMLKFLNDTIKFEHFEAMKRDGFNFVRLPLGYWNLVRLYDIDCPPEFTASQCSPENIKRWNALGNMLTPAQYRPFIDRVMHFARASGLRVLLDHHGAPGGQSTDEDTGCALSAQSDIGAMGNFFFTSPNNLATGVAAVKQIAEICKAHLDTCYGIELLNEPAPLCLQTPGCLPILDGSFDLTMDSIGDLFDGTTYRDILVDFYKAAIQAARVDAQLPPEIPIVIMDFPWWLAFYWGPKPLLDPILGTAPHQILQTLPNAGTLIYETHIYQLPGVQAASVKSLVNWGKSTFEDLLHDIFTGHWAKVGTWFENLNNWDSLDSVDDLIWSNKIMMMIFAAFNPHVKMFVGEYALDQMPRTLSMLSGASRAYYHNLMQFDATFMGAAIWNYDGVGGWGAINQTMQKGPRTWWLALNQAYSGQQSSTAQKVVLHYVSTCRQCNVPGFLNIVTDWCLSLVLESTGVGGTNSMFEVGVPLSQWGCSKVSATTPAMRNPATGQIYVVEVREAVYTGPCSMCLIGQSDCVAACTAFGYGTTGTCANPNSTDPDRCCACETATTKKARGAHALQVM